MPEVHALFQSSKEFATHLQLLRQERRKRKFEIRAKGLKRRALTPKERQIVLSKTGGRCHICGGHIVDDWAADHVFAHSQGGEHSVDNYLPAHGICNNYRWFYGTEEFQWILKLGVWFRTKIENEHPLALRLAEKFMRYEAQRDSRRRQR